jgi:DNA polymerase I-like protein with 3'-5' exonuclease and polymerase domains
MKHRGVANIPRATSLYGENMRAMFGVNVKEGFYQLGYDFASLEAMIESHYCWRYDADKEYCNSLVLEKPNDVHTKTAAKISQVIGQEFKRTPAKSVKYCCSYGGQPKRVAKTVGCSLELGAQIHAAFWDAAKPLAELAEKLKKYWETTGQKKFILGVDGRKIPTRSASALINSLFQSAGVICAKRSMVIHERKLKEAGLFVDFFRDDWKSRAFVQQLIAYHDEAQMEVHKSLIKWKFVQIKGPWEVEVDGKMEPSPEVKAAEAELKAFKAENPGWSEIGHSDKACYIGYTAAGTLIQESVVEASRFYNLNVTLAADYILGRNWRECH